MTKINPDDQLLLHFNKEKAVIIDDDEYIIYNSLQMNEKNPVLVFDLKNKIKSNLDFETCKICLKNRFFNLLFLISS